MRGIGSSNCSKSNNSSSSSSNRGRPELAQSYTNLGLTQDSEWYGRYNEEPYIPDTLWRVCHRKKSMCRGVCRFGRGVQPRHLPMH